MAENLADGEVAVSSGAVRFAALSYLAQREHSRHELHQKLSRRFPEQLIQEVLNHLAGESLQCDWRFTEAFIRSRISRGQGPYRIRQELRLKGVEETIVEPCLDEYSKQHWLELAQDVCSRKFKTEAKDPKEIGRRLRFLQYRGFDSETVRKAVKV